MQGIYYFTLTKPHFLKKPLNIDNLFPITEVTVCGSLSSNQIRSILTLLPESGIN